MIMINAIPSTITGSLHARIIGWPDRANQIFIAGLGIGPSCNIENLKDKVTHLAGAGCGICCVCSQAKVAVGSRHHFSFRM